MNAEILSVGTELLMGEIVDTNAAYLAARLPSIGLMVRGIHQVGDDLDDLVGALRRGWERAEVVLVTGGLGPTEDDLTHESIARLLGEHLERDENLVQALEAYFAGRGVVMPERNLKQAQVIPSAVPLVNTRGTAPGWWVERDGKIITTMPGVPHEMQTMWEDQVTPRLRGLHTSGVIYTRTFKVFGLSEAAVADRVPDLFGRDNPYVGIYAKQDGIHLRAIARAPTREEARRLVEPLEAMTWSALEGYLWGVDEDTPEARLGELLRAKGLTVATMESVTGGLIASTITDVAGSSAYFKAGYVAYSPDAKVSLGVAANLIEEFGVVSQEVAAAMAEAARAHAEADLGIATTGAAGPESLESHMPGSIYIGLSVKGETRTLPGRYPPQRQLARRRATAHALLEACRLIASY